MKTLIRIATTLMIATSLIIPARVFAQDAKEDAKEKKEAKDTREDAKEKKLMEDSREARKELIKTDKLMQNFFDNSAGYVIFPNVGKGAVGVSGAFGNGIVFVKGKPIGKASLTQVNVGAQLGGKAYREVIFFENEAALDRFQHNKLEFDASVSAVAATEGASANKKYTKGVMVFTQEKGGLMFEAAIGGQKFKYESL